jgi:hypothetical protein
MKLTVNDITFCPIFSGLDKEMQAFRSIFEDLTDHEFNQDSFIFFRGHPYALGDFSVVDYTESNLYANFYLDHWRLMLRQYTGETLLVRNEEKWAIVGVYE